MNSVAQVSVIIPNYNGLKYLPDCIAALSKQTYKDFEIIVVENGSSDGSLEWLKENHVGHISLLSNKGFAGGVNAGIMASQTPFVILLNNDTQVQETFVEELTGAIMSNPRIFSVSSMMIKAQNHDLIDDAGDGLTLLGWGFQRGLDMPLKGFEKPANVFSACGGASIYRKSVFEEIGYFDEMHFAYLEDIDIGYRARLAGYINTYCPSARVYHLGSATSGSKYNSFKVKLSARNNIFLHYKNQPLLQRVINFIPFTAGIIIKGIFFIRKGFFNDYVQGIAEGLKKRHQCKKASPAARGILAYIEIEFQLVTATFIYFFGFIKKHIS